MGTVRLATFSDNFVTDKVFGFVQFAVKITKNLDTDRCLAVSFNPNGDIVQIESFFYKGDIDTEFATKWFKKVVTILRADESKEGA